MLDDFHNWYITPAGLNYSKIEGLGHAAQFIFDTLPDLQRFENDVKSRAFNDCDEINSAWARVWAQFSSLNTTVFYGVLFSRPLTSDDISDFEERTGIHVSHDAVFQHYRALVDRYYGCCELDPVTTRPVFQ